MLNKTLYLSFLAFAAVSCGGDDRHKPEINDRVPAPEGVYYERLAESIVKLNWRDVSEGDVRGYGIYLLGSGASGPLKIGEASYGATDFIITEGLVSGDSYMIGVKAECGEDKLSSDISYVPLKMIPFQSVPAGTVSSLVSTPSCLAVSYFIRNHSSLTNLEAGLCWSDCGTACYSDSHLAGPVLENDKALQVVSCLYLEYGRTYNIRVYIKSDEGEFYIDAGEASLSDEPSEIKFDWKQLSEPGVPDGISVYETTGLVGDRPLHAYYAVADLAGSGLELRTNVPSKAATIDSQSASFGDDCYVLVNGGYFASGIHTGIAIDNYAVTGSINNQRGSIDPADPYNTVYYPTARGFFGVDENGKPSVCWANGSGYGVAYFSKPIPSVKAEAKYVSSPSSWASAEIMDWLPRAGISAAPVLLKDGKRPFDFTTTPKGPSFYYTNFEFVAADIFGASSVCDRTAIGATGDGKVVLFICDGRMSSSPGVDLMELSMIMKGLGCTDAVNLDGGGSTGMMVGKTHFGDMTVDGNRKVMSTVGFFRRK